MSLRALISLVLLAAALATVSPARAQAQDQFYFWMVPREDPPFTRPDRTQPKESFVIRVDASAAAQIRSLLAENKVVGCSGRIAAAPADYNRDYYTRDHRVWNWHFVSIEEILDLKQTVFPPSELPFFISKPSEIAADPSAWIQANGDLYKPQYFHVASEIDPSRPDSVANVANRGKTGGEEATLISGFIIQGGEPRNVVLRGLGPSLAASGVQNAAANPKIEVYQGVTKIAENDDWKTDQRTDQLQQNYPGLMPTSDREAALLLTLLPGTYTIHCLNAAGVEGIALIEVYDVDSAPGPSMPPTRL